MLRSFRNSSEFPKTFLFVLIIICLILLGVSVIWGWNGTYARYAADDYQTGFQLREKGFFQSQVYWYSRWTGRFSMTLSHSILLEFGPGIVRVLPVTLIFLFNLIWVFIFRYFFRVIQIKTGLTQELLLAQAVLFGAFSAMPDLRQTLFWQPGICNYALPLLLFSCTCLALLKELSRSPQQNQVSKTIVVLIGATSFFGAGFTESFIPIQLVFFAAILIGCLNLAPKESRSKTLILFSVGFIATTIAGLIVIGAPGNAMRLADYPPHPGFETMMKMAIDNTFTFLNRQFLDYPFLFGFVFLAASLIGATIKTDHIIATRRILRFGWILPLGFLLIGCLVFFTNAWAINSYPVPRTLSTPQFFLSISILLAGFWIGVWIHRINNTNSQFPVIIILVLCIYFAFMGPIQYSINQVQNEIPVAQLFAQQWDEQESILRQAASDHVQEIAVKETINYYNVEQLTPITNRYQWINWAMSNYYQIPVIYRK